MLRVSTLRGFLGAPAAIFKASGRIEKEGGNLPGCWRRVDVWSGKAREMSRCSAKHIRRVLSFPRPSKDECHYHKRDGVTVRAVSHCCGLYDTESMKVHLSACRNKVGCSPLLRSAKRKASGQRESLIYPSKKRATRGTRTRSLWLIPSPGFSRKVGGQCATVAPARQSTCKTKSNVYIVAI